MSIPESIESKKLGIIVEFSKRFRVSLIIENQNLLVRNRDPSDQF